MIEAALAHVVRNQTEAAYARSDLFERRRLLMDDWAAYIGRRNDRHASDSRVVSHVDLRHYRFVSVPELSSTGRAAVTRVERDQMRPAA